MSPQDESSIQQSNRNLGYRQEILEVYKRAKANGEITNTTIPERHAVKSKFRDCLEDFLPNKLGVASGHVLPHSLGKTDDNSQYDIIIYDAINAPDSTSRSEGKIITAECILGVLEIKPTFNDQTVRDALSHLKELKPLMKRGAKTQKNGPAQLPQNFFCATIFCMLKKAQKENRDALKTLADHADLKRFFGGLILEKEGPNKNASGKLNAIWANEPVMKQRDNQQSADRTLFDEVTSDTLKVNDDMYITMSLSWDEDYFSQFLYKIKGLMKGDNEQTAHLNNSTPL